MIAPAARIIRMMPRLKQTLRAVLNRYFVPSIGGVPTEVTDSLDAIRKDLVEIQRMIRQQGDAADQVAEILGRTLARLSVEVADLSETLARAEDRSGRIETSA
jgi:hypothetical protein